MKPFNDMCMSPMEKEFRENQKKHCNDVFTSPMERDFKQKQMNLNAMREFDDFKKTINGIVANYINLIDTKIANQDLNISKATTYIQENIMQATTDFLTRAFQNGEISIGLTYDAETETLYIGGVIVE